tara:strand:+ start:2880 stop:3527 length:648 start_codon:yes stop_codon:yes gene_type:complete
MRFTETQQEEIITTFLSNLLDAEALWTGREEELAQRIIDAGEDILSYMFDDYFTELKQSAEKFYYVGARMNHTTEQLENVLEVNGVDVVLGHQYHYMGTDGYSAEVGGEYKDYSIEWGDVFNICPITHKYFYAGRQFRIDEDPDWTTIQTVGYSEDYCRHIEDLIGHKLKRKTVQEWSGEDHLKAEVIEEQIIETRYDMDYEDMCDMLDDHPYYP